MYSFIFSMLFFAAVVKMMVKFDIRAVSAALLAVFMPFFFSTAISLIYVIGRDLPLTNLVSSTDIIITILQLAAAFGVFRYLEHDDSFSAWLGAITIGALSVYIAIPFVVRTVLVG